MGKANFSDDFKRDAVAQITERGYPVVEVSRRLGVRPHSLYAWKKKFAKPFGSDGENDAKIRRLKRELGRVTEGLPKVLFTDFISGQGKFVLIKNCATSLLPYIIRSEAFGLYHVEAAMFGRPMISRELGTGTLFVNAPQETSYVIPPNQPEALSDAMNSLFSSSSLRGEYGKQARARLKRLLSGVNQGGCYAELYLDVQGRGK